MYKPFYPYHIYIVSKFKKTTLYVGVTNDLRARITEHWMNRGHAKTFAGRYFCYFLIYYECFEYIQDAIAREKEIKKWSRKKKEELVQAKHPSLSFLNSDVFEEWPPRISCPR